MDDTWPGKFYTIRTGFNRYCTDPVLTQAIPGLVQSVTRAAFEGSRLANLYVLECLENQPANNLNLGPLDQGFFYQVFSAISTGGREGPNQLRNFSAQDIQGSPAPGNLASRAGRVLAPPAWSRRPPASVCVPSRLRSAVQSPLKTVPDELPEPRGSQPGAESAWLPQLQDGQV
jgi:hypothetical protein